MSNMLIVTIVGIILILDYLYIYYLWLISKKPLEYLLAAFMTNTIVWILVSVLVLVLYANLLIYNNLRGSI